MKITAIYATGRKGISTTYNLAQTVINELKGDDDVKEFFLPRDMNHFCAGCFQCIEGHRERCGGYSQVKAIKDAMDSSDLIIFTAPVYVYHIPGQLKALLDHFACNWASHRPDPSMFHKQALVITTAAGAGTRSTVKDIKDNLDFWCVGRIYTYRKNVRASGWSGINDDKQKNMKKQLLKISSKIRKRAGNVTPRLKVKAMFYFFRSMQIRMKFNPVDVTYWKEQGWLDKVRPW